MVEGGGGGPAFPVVFFDGEREMNIGNVQINPFLEYKPFQLMLSRKIGISPNQISIYLVDRKKIPMPPFTEARRRIPITGKVNFELICRLKECCFLVVLKRSRKSRNRRDIITNSVAFSDFISDHNDFSPPAIHSEPENLILLRRNQPAPFYEQIAQSELADLNNRLQSLSLQRENYLLAMGNSPDFRSVRDLNPNPNAYSNMEAYFTPQIDDYFGVLSTSVLTTKNDGAKPFCEECAKANENDSMPSFHPCVRDAVITRFTSRLGPISRPNKPLP